MTCLLKLYFLFVFVAICLFDLGFFIDEVHSFFRACLVATIRSSGASQSTIKLVATNLIASGKLTGKCVLHVLPLSTRLNFKHLPLQENSDPAVE